MPMLKIFFIALSGLLTVLILRTLLLTTVPDNVINCSPEEADFIKLDTVRLERFQKALRFPTVSRSSTNISPDELLNIQNHIYNSYDAIHSSPFVEREVVANYSLLYHVKGTDPKLKPYLLMAHLDVVPADNVDEWEAPPFAGSVKGEYIYGRGTIDDKHAVFGILEAVEYALKNGFRPMRSMYLAFGHDEEVMGSGAHATAALLAKRNIDFAFILDEGTTVLDGVVPIVDVPVALVGISEKGWLNLRLSVNTTGGHSSMPGPESSIGILSRAVTRLENNPHPNMIGTGPEKATFEGLAYTLPFHRRVVIMNLWLFKPLIGYIFSYKPSSNAVIRTTTAVTEFHAGIKDNVLPPWAWATVNHRVHPGQTIDEVLSRDRQIIGDDRVKIEVVGQVEPHPVSPYEADTYGYQTIKTSIHQIWGHKNVAVVPGLMIGNTDTGAYLNLSKQIYRFAPTYMYPDDPPRFHGLNERISLKNYEEAINYYYHVIMNADRAELPQRHTHSGEL